MTQKRKRDKPMKDLDANKRTLKLLNSRMMRAKVKSEKLKDKKSVEAYNKTSEELIAFLQLLKRNDELVNEIDNMKNMLDEVLIHEIDLQEQETSERESETIEQYNKIFSFPTISSKKNFGAN